jgi:hypothetical protein
MKKNFIVSTVLVGLVVPVRGVIPRGVGAKKNFVVASGDDEDPNKD